MRNLRLWFHTGFNPAQSIQPSSPPPSYQDYDREPGWGTDPAGYDTAKRQKDKLLWGWTSRSSQLTTTPQILLPRQNKTARKKAGARRSAGIQFDTGVIMVFNLKKKYIKKRRILLVVWPVQTLSEPDGT